MTETSSRSKIRWSDALPVAAGILVILIIGLILVGVLQHPLISGIKDYPGLITGYYFDAQGLALTVGHLDAPCETLEWEAIRVDDKCYGYFGLTPSLFRIMLNGLCLSCFGQWSRLMMVAGGLIYFVACLLLADRVLAGVANLRARRCWVTGFALIMSLGTSLIFIISDPYGYHEAILWANALGLLAFWSFRRYLDEGRPWALRLALILVFLALHARFTVGIGVAAGCLLSLSFPFLPRLGEWNRPRLRTILSPVMIICFLAVTPIIVNQLKFGAVVPPAQNQKFYAKFPERLEKIKNGIFQTSNLKCDSFLYLSPTTIDIRNIFPYFLPKYDEYYFAGQNNIPEAIAAACTMANVESLDPMYSITAAMPAALLLFLAGLMIVALRRGILAEKWLPPLAGASLACLPLLFLSSVTYRYTLDFTPMLIIGSLVAWREIAALPVAWAKSATVLLVVCLTGWGFAVNLAACLSSGSPQPYVFQLARDLRHILGSER